MIKPTGAPCPTKTILQNNNMQPIFPLLALISGSIAAQHHHFLPDDNDPDYNKTNTTILPTLRLRLMVLEKFVEQGWPSELASCDLDLESAFYALKDVILFETLFKERVKMYGFQAVGIYVAEDFKFHHVDGRIFNRKQYLDYLSERKDLTFYFGNPQNPRYGEGKELYVVHEDNYTRYQFQFHPEPTLPPKYRLVSVKLEPLWFSLRTSAISDALKFEKAFRELAVTGMAKAEIYIDPNFVYIDFYGKKKNKQQFLDYLSHDGNLRIYFTNPRHPEFDNEGNLVYSHVGHHVNFRCVARPSSLKGGYVLVSVIAGVQNRESDGARIGRENSESLSSSSSEEDTF